MSATLLAYCDPFSASPGESVSFMVSCEGAGAYDCQIVRLYCCDTHGAGPDFREVEIESDRNGSYPGRRQRIDLGSYALVERLEGGGNLAEFTLQAYVWPTRLAGRMQSLLGSWNEADGTGFCLCLDQEGAVALRVADGSGGAHLASTGVPLRERQWSLVAATFDTGTGEAHLFQQPLTRSGASERGGVPIERRAALHQVPALHAELFLIAAWIAGSDSRGILSGGHFEGKIDRPRFVARCLDWRKIESLGREASGPLLEEAVLGFWDFSREMSSDRIVDLSGRGNHGVTVNLPARAVTGFNWSGAEQDWRHAPEQYGAMHFHSDDLSDARWEVDFSLPITPALESGVYAARLTAPGAQIHVPFVVRAGRGQRKSDAVLLVSTATYMAYANCRARFTAPLSDLTQGRLTILDELDLEMLKRPELGLSTYDRHADGSGVMYSSRLRPIINNRPKTSDVTIAYDNFATDLLIVDWLSRFSPGFDVITDEDLHREGVSAVERYRVLITCSHPEYASKEMRDALDLYLERGGRLMYLGGNGLYWRIAFHPERPAIIEVRRAEDGVRAWEAEPGEYFHSFTGEYGGLWRRQGRPPNTTLGVGFIAQGFDASSGYRRTPMSYDQRVSFIFKGIEDDRLGDFGLLLGGAAGLELDRASGRLGTPAHALVIATSFDHSNIYHLVPEEINSTSGFTDGTLNPDVRSDIVFFETSGGGAVFSAGSIAFAGALSHNAYDNNISKMTGNVLRRFLDPAAFRCPARNPELKARAMGMK